MTEPTAARHLDLAEIRAKAERTLVYPLTRDECLWLVGQAEAMREQAIQWEVAASLYQESHDDHDADDGCAACHAYRRAVERQRSGASRE